MKTIDIGEWVDIDGVSVPNGPAALKIRALMFFPNDEKDRDNYFGLVAAYLDLSQRDPSFPQGASITALGQAIASRSNGSIALLPGSTAGEILYLVVQIDQHHSKHRAPSVNKAVAVLKARRRAEPDSGRGSKLLPHSLRRDARHPHANENSIRKDWASYKSVAPLWAACRFIAQSSAEDDRHSSQKIMEALPGEARRQFSITSTLYKGVEDVPAYLAAMEYFRRFAEKHTDRNGRRLLQSGEAWQLPEDFKFRKTSPIELPPLDALDLDALKKYRAKK